jgi:hypothetical protein
MNDAPETLWVDPSSMDDLDMYVGHDSSTMDYLNMDVEYARSDIAQARIKELEAALATAKVDFDEIAETCWDKIDHNALRAACEESCLIACDAATKIEALKAKP